METAEAEAIRRAAEAEAARGRGDEATAADHQLLAESNQAMGQAYRDLEAQFAAGMDDYERWKQDTAGDLLLAQAADAELRRRHPEQHFDPLKSAEPAPPAAGEPLLLVSDGPGYTEPDWLDDLKAKAAESRQRWKEHEERWAGMRTPAEDPGYGYEGLAFPDLSGRDRDAIIQPPKPEILPAPEVERLIAQREAEPCPAEWQGAEAET